MRSSGLSKLGYKSQLTREQQRIRLVGSASRRLDTRVYRLARLTQYYGLVPAV